jgi:hypothetical protein
MRELGVGLVPFSLPGRGYLTRGGPIEIRIRSGRFSPESAPIDDEHMAVPPRAFSKALYESIHAYDWFRIL